MNLATVDVLLEQRGITLSIGPAGQLLAKPAGNIPPELAQIIREHREQLLTKLKEEQATEIPAAEAATVLETGNMLPETERQDDDTPRAWYRPTVAELARWDTYYQGADWYAGKNRFQDNPAGLALEYVTDRDAEVCCTLFSRQLLAFYGDCQARQLDTSDGPRDLDPLQYTEALRQAYQERRGAALLALACNFLQSTARQWELQGVLIEHGFTLPPNQESRPAPAMTSTRQDDATSAPAPAPGQESKRKGRAIVYADITAGRALTEQARRIDFRPGATLAELVSAVTSVAECDRLFLCGDIPDNFEAWLALDAGMYATYSMGKRGHYLSAEKAVDYVARFQHKATGQELEVRTMHSWWGDVPYTVEEAQGAMHLLTLYLQREFLPDVRPYATPALTYQALWQLLNRLDKKRFEQLPEDIRKLIHGSSGQGRIELCTLDELKELAALYYYDGVFFYSALCWGMPTELAAHDNKNEYAGKVPARYRIRYTVPSSWQHVGLFMTPKDKVTGNPRDNAAWCYPGQDYAGRTFETWADGAELDVLIDNYTLKVICARGATKAELQALNEQAQKEGQARAFAAWNIEILERVVFKPEKDSEVKKPLDKITERLSNMRDKVERDMLQDTTRLALYRLVRAAIRNILLHGIGSFHRTEREVTYILQDDEPAPDGYSNMRLIGEHTIRYSVPQKTERYTQQFEHPEWTALIWARARARITKAALSLPRRELVAIRTDAIAVSTEQPQWADNSKRGTLRQKWQIVKKLKAPHSLDELDALVHKHVKEDK